MRDRMARWVARKLPLRVIYWSVIFAGVRYATAHPREEVPAIALADTLRFLHAESGGGPSWPIRLRKRLLLRRDSWWNAWVRDWTGRLERRAA